VFAVGGLVYSLLILVEVRLSPQLHRWIYGYHQHTFSQSVRWGGYRPMVFMRHGLNVSLFIVLCILAMTSLAHARQRLFGVTFGLLAGYLSVILVLCKSTGAVVYALLFLPVAIFLSPRKQVGVAAVVGALVFSYPLLRSLDLVPTTAVGEFFANNVNEERADSLGGRLDVEKMVMEKVRQRPLFGWGGYARSWVYDAETGRSLTVIDGLWVLVMGRRGIVGYIGVFGLFLFPVFQAWRKLKFIRAKGDRSLVAGLSLIVMLYVLDFIPNASVDAALTFCVGALAGVVPGILGEQRRLARRSSESLGRKAEAERGAVRSATVPQGRRST
jgi:O-antigen ligase